MFEHREWLKWKLLCSLVSKISNHSFLNLSWILWVQMAVISPPDVGCHVFSVGNFVTKNVFKPVRCSASMLWLITTVFRKPCHLCHLEISLNTFINCLPVDTINPHRLVMWFFFPQFPYSTCLWYSVLLSTLDYLYTLPASGLSHVFKYHQHVVFQDSRSLGFFPPENQPPSTKSLDGFILSGM